METRVFREVKLLCLLPENESESTLIDDYLGSDVGEDGLICRVYGEVRLADGYGEHYISLRRVEGA